MRLVYKLVIGPMDYEEMVRRLEQLNEALEPWIDVQVMVDEE